MHLGFQAASSFPSSPKASMPSRKEAQPGRIGHRKDRRHSSIERVNTARADNEHCNAALQQVNTVDDLPALDAVEFSATESPTLRRLQHPAYELSEGPGRQSTSPISHYSKDEKVQCRCQKMKASLSELVRIDR